MKRFAVWFAVTAAAIALAACNNSSTGPSAPSTPCPTPAGDTTVLVYPAPGATSVPGTFGQVIIGSTTALGSGYNIVVTDAVNPNGIPGQTLTSVTPPFPTPNATPSFPNPKYESSSYSGFTFLPSQVVNVYVNQPSSNCSPVGPVGSFST